MARILGEGEDKLLRAVWHAMKRRCTNPRVHNFARYGGRGIKVAPAWVASFDTFLRDVGPRPSRAHSLDRFPDRDGDYEPGNVRWATREEQARNRVDNRSITHDGRTLLLVEWAEETGIAVTTLWRRLEVRGWSIVRALTEGVGAAQRTYIELDGARRHLGAWARITGIPWSTIRRRLALGWVPAEALRSPIQPRTAPRRRRTACRAS